MDEELTPSRVPTQGLRPLDSTIAELIEAEEERQARKLIFIASESICPPAVRRVMASPLSHIYAEGYPAPRMNVLSETELADFDEAFVNFKRYSDRRYYKGTDYMNVIEAIAKRRASDVFANERVPSQEVYANVQPLSGAAANNAVYQAFLENGDRILGMSLVSGGHLTHGSPVNRSGRTYDVASYSVGRDGKLDYDKIADQAADFKPKLIVAGFSAYPWDIDWEALRHAADKAGALLMADISHTAGLVAAGAVKSPVGYADVMTFTTHKTLCGPRGAVILTTDEERAKQIDLAVFPGEQGGPHMHQIASKAVAFKLAESEGFNKLMGDVVENASAMAESFEKRGFTLAYGGTDTHLLLLDLRKVKTASGLPLTGEIASRVLDMVGITCNKNTIAGDTSAAHPSGLRFGTTWVTQRGFGPRELDKVAELVSKVLPNLHSYSYFYSGGEVGRAKLDFDLMEEVQAGVDELVEQAGDVKGDWEKDYPHYVLETEAQRSSGEPTPIAERDEGDGLPTAESNGRLVTERYSKEAEEKEALQKNAGLVDLGDCVMAKVTGRRAANFLHCSTTADVLALKPGQGTTALVLDSDGELQTDVSILSTSTHETTCAWSDELLVRLGPAGRPARTLRWLRDLSDGYLYHDEDIYLKAEGPAVVAEAHGESGTPLTCFAVVGPKALEACRKVFGDETPKLGDHAAASIDGHRVTLFARAEGQTPVVELMVEAQAARPLWEKLSEGGAAPCGRNALLAAEPELGWPVSHERPSADQVAGSTLSRRVAWKKPFFVGQKKLLQAAAEVGAEEVESGLEPVAAEEWKEAFDVEVAEGKKTCLYEEHLKLTAKRNIVPFAGWQMPVWYDSIINEHNAVRTTAGLFDVSHMGVLSIRGKLAERFLDLVTANYVPWLDPGQCHYSYLLDHHGHVIDDVIVYREGRDDFMMVVNAANAEVDEAWLRALNRGEVAVDPKCPLKQIEGSVEIRNMKEDESLGERRRVDLAFQGRQALPVLHKLMSDPGQRERLAKLPSFHLMTIKVQDIELIAARTGYTGEQVGFELFPQPEQAPKLWNLILEAGEELGVKPTGLGARDSTRCEAGFPLHGHELAGPNDINPLEAGYAPFVRFHKPYFVGRSHTLESYKSWKREVVRFQTIAPGGRNIKPGSPVVDGRRGRCLGAVTSCVNVDRYQVGLALVDRGKLKVGSDLQVFPLPPSKRGPAPKAPTELEPGDRTTLPQEATVISRFMKPDETRESALVDAKQAT
jgi:glycine cleavage system T protein